MRNKLGNFLMIIGTALILGALSLYIYNYRTAETAGQAIIGVMPQLIEEIEIKVETEETAPEAPDPMNVPEEFLDPSVFEMTEVEIDGYRYIGYLSIPSLELDLPVQADWDYKKLKISPCRYSGTVKGEDLVIMAHNYTRHFGKLSQLSEGDSVVFMDMNGAATEYVVVGYEILDPYSVEEVTSGAYDLILFTCTYGGQNRVTVYCDRAENG